MTRAARRTEKRQIAPNSRSSSFLQTFSKIEAGDAIVKGESDLFKLSEVFFQVGGQVNVPVGCQVSVAPFGENQSPTKHTPRSSLPNGLEQMRKAILLVTQRHDE